MHETHIHRYRETHGAPDEATRSSERRTWAVVALTFAMMVVEIAAGSATGSLALFADGVHMATHVGAIGLSALAYAFARRWSKHDAFTFGTGKVYALAGYTSAIILAVAAGWMAIEAVLRLVHPESIDFRDALPVAVIGLVVNLASALLLGHGHDHDHGHDHHHDDHDHDHDHAPGPSRAKADDHNLRAAYLHVVADALTSVLAILAIVAGQYFHVVVFDPIMGIVGAAIILKWSAGLVRTTGQQLLDVSPSVDDTKKLKIELEAVDDVQVADLHLWDIGPGLRGCIVKLVTSTPRETDFYRSLIKEHVAVSHLTVEVHHCREQHGVS